MRASGSTAFIFAPLLVSPTGRFAAGVARVPQRPGIPESRIRGSSAAARLDASPAWKSAGIPSTIRRMTWSCLRGLFCAAGAVADGDAVAGADRPPGRGCRAGHAGHAARHLRRGLARPARQLRRRNRRRTSTGTRCAPSCVRAPSSATERRRGAGHRARDARPRRPVALCHPAGAGGVGDLGAAPCGPKTSARSDSTCGCWVRRWSSPGSTHRVRRTKAGVRAGWTLTRVGARAVDDALADRSATRRPTSAASGPGRWARRCCGARPARTPTWGSSTPRASPSRACSCARRSAASPSSSGTCRPLCAPRGPPCRTRRAAPSASSRSTSG